MMEDRLQTRIKHFGHLARTELDVMKAATYFESTNQLELVPVSAIAQRAGVPEVIAARALPRLAALIDSPAWARWRK